MARESCNLDKEEAEILKPPSPSPSSSTPPPPPPAAASPSLLLKPPPEPPVRKPEMPETPTSDPGAAASSCDPEKKPAGEARFSTRCSSCRRRVRLAGFRCRCGDLFCARHRYSNTHDCSFDYKAAGREEISRANPLIRAAKIIKI